MAKLYKLSEDLGESKDLAASEPEKVRELQEKWNQWNQSNVPPLWGGGKSDSDGDEPGGKSGKKAKQGKP